MHILLLPSWYPTSQNPVSGLFMREQALALQEARHQVGVLVSPMLRSKKKLVHLRRWADLRPSTSVEDDMGVATYRHIQWGWFPGFWAQGNRRLVVKAGLHLFEHYVQEQGVPDVIHAHNVAYGGYLATLIREKWHIPVVLTEHSSRFSRDLIRRDEKKIIVRTLAYVDYRLAVSKSLADILQTYYDNCEIEIIGNVVDVEYFVPSVELLPVKPFIFLVIALLSPNKNIDVLLESFARAFRDKNVQLYIGGDGSIRATLEQQASSLGIASQVQFLGMLSREQVKTYIQQSHVLVSSSHVETFGVTLIEAMACGKPVIATRSGGPESFVEAHNGILVPPADPPALATAMQCMITDYAQYDAQKIRAACVARFSKQAIIQRLEQIYQQLLPS